MKKDKHINIYVTQECLNQLKSYAQNHRWTLSTAAAAILEDFLRENENAPAAAAEPPREPQA